jgi:hypothetical protein
MPPLQALAALHGLWAIALTPFTVWAVRRWPPARLRIFGYTVTALGLVGLGILVGREWLTWYRTVSPSLHKYIVQRLLYVLGTNTDLPVIQVVLAGLALWFGARIRQRNVLLVEAESLGEDPLKEAASGSDGRLNNPQPPTC